MCRLLLLAAAASLALAQPGPTDRQKVNDSAADRGRAIYLQSCINCHGSLLQGTDDGPDLVRSVPVLHDNTGNELGPLLKKLPRHQSDLTSSQVADLSNFLKQRIEYVAQDRNPAKPPNVYTGSAALGKTYFEGAGKCTSCHKADGDLAGIAKHLDSLTVQQRFLFPRARPTIVKVTPPGVQGTLVRIDDFNVSLRDAEGNFKSYARSASVKVELTDPLAYHHELLDRIQDSEIHNVVTYLGSLK